MILVFTLNFFKLCAWDVRLFVRVCRAVIIGCRLLMLGIAATTFGCPVIDPPLTIEDTVLVLLEQLGAIDTFRVCLAMLAGLNTILVVKLRRF